jgi:hypothetical protein
LPLSLDNRRVVDFVVVACTGRIVEGGEVTTLPDHVNDLAAGHPHVIRHLLRHLQTVIGAAAPSAASAAYE